MIYWPLARIIEGGVKDILVVTSKDHMDDIIELLGSGHDLDINLTYRVQDVAGGIAQALGLAEGFVATDSCVVMLGDNIFARSLEQNIRSFSADSSGASVILTEVSDPERFGVAELSDDGSRILSIEEKPDRPKSNLVVTGCYMYEHTVFDIIKTLKPSGRGELEITDVNNYYVENNLMRWTQYEGDWTDAGTFSSLLRANQIAFDVPIPDVISSIMERT
jgi:glucose-1-phosphate thymidylyltransferase